MTRAQAIGSTRAAINAYREGKLMGSGADRQREINTLDETATQRMIRQKCRNIADFLVAKNRAYGNSATDPCRVFSKADSVEQLYVRIDDKLNRIMKGSEYPGDDTILDLVGYLVLVMVVKEGEGEEM